jgi:TPR repeat protein
MTDNILTESKNDNKPRNERVSIILSSTSSETLSFDTLSLDAQSFKSISSKSPSTINLTFSPTEENFPSSLKPNNKKKKNILISIKEKIPNPTDILRNVKKDIKNFISNDKKRKKESDFLGYYECLNTSELLNPKISLSTARINLHEGESVDEAKRLVITKIKNAPYVDNVSLFIIPGKGNHINSSNIPGILNKSFSDWMNDDSIKGLVDGNPIKGDGTYEVFIKSINNNNNNNNNNFYHIKDKVLKDWKEKAKKNDDIKYKMALAGYYMKGPKENHFEAESWYKKAEKLGSMEAKLCLGYMHSIGKLRFDPKRAKDLFKSVINKLEKSNNIKDKELSRIAMRNMALVYHNSHFIKPFEWDNLTKISRLSDLKVNKLSKIKLKIAVKWYLKSCNLGDSQSAYNLGLLYESDNGIIKDFYQAEIYFKKAIEFDNNNLYAKAKLGRFLINKNDELEKDKGFKLLEETSNIGLVMSQTYLGEYYEKQGNIEEAMKFYFKAAKQNRGRYSHIAQYHFKELTKDILESFERDLSYGYINCVERLNDIC